MIKPPPEHTPEHAQEFSLPVNADSGGTDGGAASGSAAAKEDGREAGIPAASKEHYNKVVPLLRERFRDRAYGRGRRFEDFSQAYLHGVACHDLHGYQVWNPQIEKDVRHQWESDPASQAMPWEQARQAIEDGWHAAEHVGESVRK